VRIVLAALCVSAVAAGTASAGIVSFRMPSKNVYCAEITGTRASLRCDILSGVKPLPPKPASCKFDWGAGFTLGRRGRARISCVSDSVYDASARVLRYGTTWRRDGFTCVSRVVGLRCRNAGGHGFFLSRQRSYRF
jgi:uncharacterized protein DUF6636